MSGTTSAPKAAAKPEPVLKLVPVGKFLRAASFGGKQSAFCVIDTAKFKELAAFVEGATPIDKKTGGVGKKTKAAKKAAAKRDKIKAEKAKLAAEKAKLAAAKGGAASDGTSAPTGNPVVPMETEDDSRKRHSTGGDEGPIRKSATHLVFPQ